MSIPRRPLTPDEAEAVKQMAGVSYPVGSWDKSFMRRFSDTVTENQSRQLWRIFVKYRRQISFPDKARLLAVAEKLAAPDFRKLEAARCEQARIDEEKAKYKSTFTTP